MKKQKLILLTLVTILCSSCLMSAQNKRVGTESQANKAGINCKTGGISFPCPKGYKVILDGNNSDGIFLAQNLEYGYGVFVLESNSSSNSFTLLPETIKTLLKNLYPKESENYRWKTAKFVNDNDSSKFEVGKKLSIGFNGNQVVTIESRYIKFNNKNIAVGTVVDGFERGASAEEEFNEGLYTSNGGCFDAIKIIHFITKEGYNEELNPCRISIEAKN